MPRAFASAIAILLSIGQVANFWVPLTYASIPNFELSPSASPVTLSYITTCSGPNRFVGYLGSVEIYLVGEGGFRGTVNLSTIVTPSGPTVSLNTVSAYLSPENPNGIITAIIRLSQIPTAVEYSLNFTGSSNTIVHTVNVTAILSSGPHTCPPIPLPSTNAAGQPTPFYYAPVTAITILIATATIIAAVAIKSRGKRDVPNTKARTV